MEFIHFVIIFSLNYYCCFILTVLIFIQISISVFQKKKTQFQPKLLPCSHPVKNLSKKNKIFRFTSINSDKLSKKTYNKHSKHTHAHAQAYRIPININKNNNKYFKKKKMNFILYFSNRNGN